MQSTLSPIVFLGGTGMILVALGFLVYAAIRRLPAGFLAIGALAWVVTVSLKFAWAIPMNTPIAKATVAVLPGLSGLLLISLYIGSLTGWTEVLITWLVLRFTSLGRVPWPKALAFGVGFGVVEALWLGFSNVANIALNAGSLNASALAQLRDPLWGAAPIVERFFVIWIHIASCVLIFLAVARRRSGWMWLAFLYKTLIDGAGAYGQIVGVKSVGFLWTLESLIVVFGVLGWLITRRVQAAYSYAPARPPVAVTGPLPDGPAAV